MARRVRWSMEGLLKGGLGLMFCLGWDVSRVVGRDGVIVGQSLELRKRASSKWV